MNWILLALDAHWAMVKAIFGKATPGETAGKPKGASVGAYLAMSKRNNLKYQKPGRRRMAPAQKVGGDGGQ